MSISAFDLAAEVGLPPSMVPDLEPVVAALRALVPTTAPQPSPALAALLAHPQVPSRPQPVARRRLFALGTAAAALSSVAVTGVAAAANELPDGAQRLVSQLSGFLPPPLQFPEPVTVVDESPSNDPEPSPSSEAPVAQRSAVGDPVDSASATTQQTQEQSQPRVASSSVAAAEVSPPPSSPEGSATALTAPVSELASADPSPSGSDVPSPSGSPASGGSGSASPAAATLPPSGSASPSAQARETGSGSPSPSASATTTVSSSPSGGSS